MAVQKRRTTLPPVSGKVPAELRSLLDAIKEIMETGEGVRGNALDRKVTLRDLLDSGLARLRAPGGSAAGGVEANVPTPNMAVPPRPSGLVAQGSFYGLVVLTWTVPQTQYNNHAYTNIYRSDEDNFANAELIGRDAGFVYTDRVRDDLEPDQIQGYYYWITYTSDANVEGPPNSPDGTYAEPMPDIGLLLEQLTGQIEAGQLATALRERIDTTELLSNANKTAIENEVLVRQDETGALAEQINTVSAAAQDNQSAIQQESSTRASETGAIAEQIDTVVTRVAGNESAIQQQATSINGLSAQFTLRLDVNGYVSGFGAFNDGQTSEFAVLADRFYVASPGGGQVMPFVIDAGVVYIDTAMIKEASIQQGQLGPISFGKIVDGAGNPVTTVAGKLRAEQIDVEGLQVGNANIVGTIRSNQNGANGRPRWSLDRNGGLEFNGLAGTRVEVNDRVINVRDNLSRMRVKIGDMNA